MDRRRSAILGHRSPGGAPRCRRRVVTVYCGATLWRSALRPIRPRPIGVGKAFGLPSLRTVRAVLPHTALQSLVSSSGVSELFKGCVEGEQSLFFEEGITCLL
jgi:hypothetical protein